MGWMRSRTQNFVTLIPMEDMVAAAPQLQVLEATVTCDCAVAPALMRGEPPFGALRLREIRVALADFLGWVGLERFSPFLATLADAALQPALASVQLYNAGLAQPQVMDALVDAALARRLRGLKLSRCTPPGATSLARLLRGGALAELEMYETLQLDAPGGAVLADALRATTTLTRLRLDGNHLYINAAPARAVLDALVGHASLRHISVTSELSKGALDLGAVLAALLEADAPALHELCAFNNSLGDAGAKAMVAALPRCHHLRDLNISFNGLSEAFAHDVLLPALRANASLRRLECTHGDGRRVFYPSRIFAQAMDLVAERGPPS